jgi:hypothetical protein
MANDKFNYPIFPDRIYTLTYPDFVYKISGEDIMNHFRRGAYLEKMLEEMDEEKEKENDQLD